MEKRIITISREFGSGGREIGKLLAKQLGYHYYDSELIRLAAEKSGYTPEFDRLGITPAAAMSCV